MTVRLLNEYDLAQLRRQAHSHESLGLMVIIRSCVPEGSLQMDSAWPSIARDLGRPEIDILASVIAALNCIKVTPDCANPVESLGHGMARKLQRT